MNNAPLMAASAAAALGEPTTGVRNDDTVYPATNTAAHNAIKPEAIHRRTADEQATVSSSSTASHASSASNTASAQSNAVHADGADKDVEAGLASPDVPLDPEVAPRTFCGISRIRPHPRTHVAKDGTIEPEDADDDARADGCCGLVVTNPVHFAIAMLVLVGFLLAMAFLFADVGLHDVDTTDVVNNSHFSSGVIAGIFAFFAICLSLHQIYQHYTHWSHRGSQRYVVRVLFMVPVYSVTAFLGLVFLNEAVYFDFVQSCYEAYTIYCFVLLLTKYVGGHHGVVQAMRLQSETGYERCPWPFNYMYPRNIAINDRFVWNLKRGALQYSVITPICALIAVIAKKAGHYQEGVWQFNNVYVYTTIIINCSQMIALYAVIWLYHGIHESIAPFRPMFKFLCVKAVVFLTFWQGVLLAALAYGGIIHDGRQFDSDQQETGVQDFVVCIEMFIAACAHYYAYPVQPYADGSIQTQLREARERGKATSEVKHRQHGDGVKHSKKETKAEIDAITKEHMAQPEKPLQTVDVKSPAAQPAK